MQRVEMMMFKGVGVSSRRGKHQQARRYICTY
jgi:hypothetical protein